MTMILVLALAGVVWVRPEQMRSILDEAVPAGDSHRVMQIGIAFIAMLLFEALIQYVQTQLANRVAQSITFDLRSEIYGSSINIPIEVFDAYSRFSNHYGNLENGAKYQDKIEMVKMLCLK